MGVTKNGKDPPEHCCRSELMHSENAPNYIFSMFEAFCEDIRLDKRNFDERYKNYENLEKTLKPQCPSGNIDQRKVCETCYMF